MSISYLLLERKKNFHLNCRAFSFKCIQRLHHRVRPRSEYMRHLGWRLFHLSTSSSFFPRKQPFCSHLYFDLKQKKLFVPWILFWPNDGKWCKTQLQLKASFFSSRKSHQLKTYRTQSVFFYQSKLAEMCLLNPKTRALICLYFYSLCWLTLGRESGVFVLLSGEDTQHLLFVFW